MQNYDFVFTRRSQGGCCPKFTRATAITAIVCSSKTTSTRTPSSTWRTCTTATTCSSNARLQVRDPLIQVPLQVQEPLVQQQLQQPLEQDPDLAHLQPGMTVNSIDKYTEVVLLHG